MQSVGLWTWKLKKTNQKCRRKLLQVDMIFKSLEDKYTEDFFKLFKPRLYKLVFFYAIDAKHRPIKNQKPFPLITVKIFCARVANLKRLATLY